MHSINRRFRKNRITRVTIVDVFDDPLNHDFLHFEAITTSPNLGEKHRASRNSKLYSTLQATYNALK